MQAAKLCSSRLLQISQLDGTSCFFTSDNNHKGATVRPRCPVRTHLHLKLKVLVLALSAEEVARDANFDGLRPTVIARRQRMRDQVLQRKSTKKKKRERSERKNGGEQSVDWKRVTEKGEKFISTRPKAQRRSNNRAGQNRESHPLFFHQRNSFHLRLQQSEQKYYLKINTIHIAPYRCSSAIKVQMQNSKCVQPTLHQVRS